MQTQPIILAEMDTQSENTLENLENWKAIGPSVNTTIGQESQQLDQTRTLDQPQEPLKNLGNFLKNQEIGKKAENSWSY